ncbi:CoA ester lyase [Pacificimonas flava]|uniref:CoA ester lyase n=2 Tax=Pacificimonas TaxID=1960290 RepID=A0A219B1F5_9SPHN|nr:MULTISPECIES: CoA ester lyase [Pacificimonas]MBZ6378219.1 CoA ester lyase [Pacificimonas aurantium]OWV32155.1 CoA ester lyase [Pacificimonas flava]
MTQTSASFRRRRSCLYMPGSNARALEKVKTLDADVVIFDLEDAVLPDQKAEARRLVAEAVRAGGYGPREVVIRINGAGTPWHGEDLIMARDAGPDAVLFPKVEAAADRFDGMVQWAMIETPRAVLEADRIAASGFAALVVGTNDLAKEMHAPITPGRDAFRVALQQTVLAARANGIAALDGVYNDIGNDEGLAAECADGALLGFDGKTLIHPSQLEIANRAFSPSEEELEHARAVVAAFAAQPEAGVLKVKGRMTERLHLEEARRTLMLAGEAEHAG